MNMRYAVQFGSLVVGLCILNAVLAPGQDFSRFFPVCRGDMTPGIALGDVNGDGRLDIVFGNGRHTPQPNLLYIQAKGGRDPFFPARPLGNSATATLTGMAISTLWWATKRRRYLRPAQTGASIGTATRSIECTWATGTGTCAQAPRSAHPGRRRVPLPSGTSTVTAALISSLETTALGTRPI